MKSRIVLFVISLLFVFPVFANNFYVGANLGKMSQDGKFDVIDESLNPTVGIERPNDYLFDDDTENTYSLFAGYKLGSDLFLEVGFARNTKVKGDVEAFEPFPPELPRGALADYKTNYTYVAFVGIWPIQNNWVFNARVGFSVWEIDYIQSSGDIPPGGLPTRGQLGGVGAIAIDNILISELSDSTSALLIGVGVSYGLTKDVELKFNIENHFVDFSFTNLELEYDALSFTVGAAYHF